MLLYLLLQCAASLFLNAAQREIFLSSLGLKFLVICYITLCAARFSHGTDARALRYLARACYDDGRHKAARRTLLGATHLFPNDHTLRFNTGLSMQVGCLRVLGGDIAACFSAVT